jgi:hypothetical protein
MFRPRNNQQIMPNNNMGMQSMTPSNYSNPMSPQFGGGVFGNPDIMNRIRGGIQSTGGLPSIAPSSGMDTPVFRAPVGGIFDSDSGEIPTSGTSPVDELRRKGSIFF